MKPITLEWISKAAEDWQVAQMSYRARKHPSYDSAVFHVQQCVEKYSKPGWKKLLSPLAGHTTYWGCINCC